MGTTTQIPLAANAASGGHQFGSLAAGLMLAAACAFSSAPAQAGLSENSNPPSLARPVHTVPPSQVQIDGSFRAVAPVLISDPLSMNPVARDVLLNQDQGIWQISDPASTAVVNATPKTEAAQPLLIPLPNAVSVGVLGLAGVGLVGLAKRFRRRLFA